MKTYSIIAETNEYLASRSSLFKGKTRVTIESGLLLDDARRILLDKYNTHYEDKYPYAETWEDAQKDSNEVAIFDDGRIRYHYDSKYFEIKEEEEESHISLYGRQF